jgi:hypothetical protein
MAARGAPEHGDQNRLGELRDLTDRRNPPLVEFAGGYPSDAPERLDR